MTEGAAMDALGLWPVIIIIIMTAAVLHMRTRGWVRCTGGKVDEVALIYLMALFRWCKETKGPVC